MSQSLYLVGYDIGDTHCQSLCLQVVKSYATSGQKSAYECPLDPKNKAILQDFFGNNLHQNDACCIIAIKKTLWHTTPRYNYIDHHLPYFIYIG